MLLFTVQCLEQQRSSREFFIHRRAMNGVADELNVDDPPETEIMPGVFIQDFRNTGGSSKTKNEDIMNGMAAELNLDDDDKGV